MRITKPTLKSTFFSLLGFVEATTPVSQIAPLEQLRCAMLAALGEEGSESFVRVTRNLRYAEDVKGLWYARSDLMGALSAMHGELWAHQTLEELDTLFRALLPVNMRPHAFHPIR
jgi:hypothetical protein